MDRSIPLAIPLHILESITEDFSDSFKVGSGGYGDVYKAVYKEDVIAIKLLNPIKGIDDEQFMNELKNHVKVVNHPNIVQFVGYCNEVQKKYYKQKGARGPVFGHHIYKVLCSEYMEGGSLEKRLSEKSLGNDWCTHYKIIKGICQGLHCLHQESVLHLDLKPANILLDKYMTPKIADFGLSRIFTGSRSHTTVKTVAGTMKYMPPELTLHSEVSDKTDIFGLGVTIIDIIAGPEGYADFVELKEEFTNQVLTNWKNRNMTAYLHQVERCINIAISCVRSEKKMRPTVDNILRILNSIETQVSPMLQISSVSELVDETKLMAISAAPTQIQPSALEVEHVGSRLSQEEEKEEATTREATGVMEPLAGKPITVIGDKYKLLLTGVSKLALFLGKESSAIKDFLADLELKDELAPEVKNWRDEVREISYDMENCIDYFMCRFGGDNAEAGFILETTEHDERLCELHRIAIQMEELKTLALEANTRRERYKIDDWKPTSVSMAVDPRLRAVNNVAATLVGIDGPKNEIINWLMDTQKNLKVVSIVGFGGLGKTTLAKQVFSKIRGQFDCKAFFPVSQRPDMTLLFNRLEEKLNMRESSRTRSLEHIIEDILDHLTEKRYLIVVDDLWDQSIWNVISRAFPNDCNGSRVIVTTRVEAVASAACQNGCQYIYKLRPLGKENSRMLFFHRIFGSEDGCPLYLKVIAAEILKKCGGLPLAIITLGSLLATQRRTEKDWAKIRNSIGAQFAENPSMDEVKCILNLSYRHLSPALRACFLCLGMYPEDRMISKSDLVRHWIGEGLIADLHGRDLEVVSRSYFSELINRSMIQPEHIEYGEVTTCTVHDMMLDLILSKSAEDNFVSVACNSDEMARLRVCKYKVHRLSLRSMASDGATNGTTIASCLSQVQVRSLALFSNSMPSLLLFKYLRVLIIYEPEERMIDLTATSHLFQLRYLEVSVNSIIELPAKFQGLVYLETVNLTCQEIKGTPSAIFHLPRLTYLSLPISSELTEDIGNLKSLRTLHMYLLLSSVKGIIALAGLTKLTELNLYGFGGFLEAPKLDALVCSIGKLHNLELLILVNLSREDNNRLASLSNPFQEIKQLELSDWMFRRVPKWIGGLHYLRILDLWVEEVSTEGISLLGELPSLVYLSLKAPDVILIKGLFPVLEYFQFFVREYLGFEAGAMPNLRTLVLHVPNEDDIIPVGVEYLLRLQEIRLTATPKDLSTWSTFREALLVHPNRPSFFLSKWELTPQPLHHDDAHSLL